MYKFTKDYINSLLSYNEYLDLAIKNVRNENSDKDMQQYTKLNIQRMKRILETTHINEALKDAISKINEKQHWILISEIWCGDAANSVPVIYKTALLNNNIDLKIALRDNHIELMNSYLTNGTKSIPILIVLDKDLNEKYIWGPRPEILQNLIKELKKAGNFNIQDLKTHIQKWYLDDKTNAIQTELIKLIKNELNNT